MDKSASVVSALADIFVDPKKVFRAADGQKGWTLLPLFLVLGAALLMQVYYFSTIDVGWYFDHVILAVKPDIPDDARAHVTRTILMIQGSVLPTIMILIMLAILALYLFLVAKTSSPDDRKYGAWFKLVIWSTMPAVLASIAVMVNFALAANPQMVSPNDLQFFSVNALFTHIPIGQPGATLMDSLTPFTLWSIALMAVGLQVWTNRTFVRSLIIAAAPYIVVFGVMAISAFG
ncbi:YIP1 family protein [Kordiimonas marina]|uniref:YIP1 family protein n=1 Tax=Kordiimonas marina TaxID=2872312 RepID=UPI001FF118EB|nr:YIP1 family protein [Kordiimonas marina]MCJ9428052.1 YIP1 family protein [Kordiimonas marina]